MNNNDFKLQENNLGLDNKINNKEINDIEIIQEKTKVSILNIFYRDQGIFNEIFSIITGKKIDPSSLVDNLGNIRSEFKKQNAANDDQFKEVA